jgi:hypothetical protein
MLVRLIARSLLVALLALVAPALVYAKAVNVELKFTAYTGDAAKADKVETVPGTAAIFLNGVPYAEQEVRQEMVPVMFDEREIAPAVWLPVESLGPAVRKGKNTIRIEFTPSDLRTEYRGRLSWATVTDTETSGAKEGKHTATNTTAAGKSEKSGRGKLVLEHEVHADFVPDAAWHHYPPVTSLADDDKKKLAAMVLARADVFQPDFAGVYRLLASDERLDLAKIKAAKCVDAAYAAGVRLDAPTADQLEFVTTGNPEVVIRRKGGKLFVPADPSVFGKIEGEDTQMCAGIALSLAFPPKIAVVKNPDGTWVAVY